ncbi:hypothetical protein F4811DRAFT_529757 [Daldinia bambusicola]|nr:hypothetical protein F4811DRAFT_529757 [Daldinia bambusicola]
MAEAVSASNSIEGDTQKAVLSPPDWLKIWRRRFHGQRWGFVAFRNAYLSDDGGGGGERWDKFKAEFERIVRLPFARDAAHAQEKGLLLPDDFDEARAKFTVQWVDASETGTTMATTAIASAESLRSRYAALRPGLDPGMSWEIFLCASPEAVKSFEGEDGAADTDETSKIWRERAPFVLAFMAHGESGLEEDHDEAAWFKPVFKVAVEVLVESLLGVLDMGTSMERITRTVRRAIELDEAAVGTEKENRKDKERLDEGESRDLDEIWWSMHPSPARMRAPMRMRGIRVIDE